MSYLIPCQCCGKEYPTNWSWFVCDKCGFRVCSFCLFKQRSPYSSGGYKCSKCAFGTMKHE